MYQRSELFIDGEWTAPGGGQVPLISPHTEAPIGTAPRADRNDVDRAVRAARAAFDTGPWPWMPPAERLAVIERFAALYKQRRAEMAELISAEVGAPISFARQAQVGVATFALSALRRLAADYEWTEHRQGFYGQEITVAKLPAGVIAAIVPWNMPQFLTIVKTIPALLAGCTVVLKPAPETPLDALLFAELAAEAGLPAGVLNVIPGDGAVGAHLVAHPGVDKVSFTGSTASGRAVARACAERLTPASLELGGKSAAVILDDADPARVAAGICQASLANSGQVCNALTRVLVPEGRAQHYIDGLAAALGDLTVGDPADPATRIGPLVAQRQQVKVRDYIEDGLRQGAKLVVGGPDLPPGIDRGWYIRPTLFTEVDNSMRIAREEIFGPVLTVLTYRDEDEAVAVANDSEYGLAGAVFTSDPDRGLAVAARVRTGSFGINEGYIMDPLAPYGGVKASGYGRELGKEGLEGYLVSQSISRAAEPA
ncbi:aldehyde dehydrogenase [Nocardia sp. NPDC051750]|uniref:aldehyde dehydrogenase n=1 Tax=Nocardia sp. NPDC051750 TaxID=3364325 RepID=UPI0037A9722F